MHGSKRLFAVVLVSLAGLLASADALEAQSSSVAHSRRLPAASRVAAIAPVTNADSHSTTSSAPLESSTHALLGDRVTPSVAATAIIEAAETVIDESVPPPASESVSVGRANRGRLRHGVAIESNDVLRLKNPANRINYGTAELVALIERSAERVAEQFPGSVLTVGDLSRERGGRVRPHRSHRVGRDADIGFYLRTAGDEPALLNRFANVSRDLTTRAPDEGLRFDVGRNWALIAAMLSDPHVDVQYIFVSNYLRDALIAEAERVGAPAELIERARVVVQEARQSPHRSHFHVRIFCPANDRPTCVDLPPFYDWVDRGAASDEAQDADAAP